MFGGGFWGAPLGGSDDQLSRERDPPPRPTKLEFPEYVPPFKPHPLTSKLSSQLQHKICHSRAFSDVSDADLEALNIKFNKNASISSLIPEGRFTARPLPFEDDLQAMLAEIGNDNEDAFREVLRMAPLPGRKKPKLAYARNFFGSLEDMARYFDDSKDQYYRVSNKTDRKKEEHGINSQFGAFGNDVEMKDAPANTYDEIKADTKEVYKGYRISSAESLSPGTRISMLKNLLKTAMHKFQCRDHEPIPQPREKLIVRGVKIQSIQYQCCVARIPQDVKLARGRFVEGPIMAVVTRDELRWREKTGLETPEKTGFVGERFDLFREVGCLLILAAQRAREGKGKSSDEEEKWWVSKERWGGGPTKWGQLASETFEDEDPSWSPEEKKLQEEKRKQQEESQKKNDTKAVDPKKLEIEDLMADGTNDKNKAISSPGLPPGSVPGHLFADPDLRPRKRKTRSMERPPGDDPVMKNGRRLTWVPPFRKKWYEDWQKLRPNASTVDAKIISKRIGNGGTEFDEVFLLTGVNHHVAMVKMKVHPDYLAWLDAGKGVPDQDIDGLKKNVLYVSRTKWFNMFSVEERKEFLVGLWSILCWINRDYIPEEEYAKIQNSSLQQDTR